MKNRRHNHLRHDEKMFLHLTRIMMIQRHWQGLGLGEQDEILVTRKNLAMKYKGNLRGKRRQS